MSSDHLTLLVLDGVYILAIAYITLRLWNRKPKLPLPPGPKPLPFIGKLGNVINGYEGRQFAEYGDKYGPICSFTILGRTFIIINDQKIAFDLLEKRSSIYASRPAYTFAGEMIGFDRWLLGALPYNGAFRMQRRFIRRAIGTRSALLASEDLKKAEVRRFLLRMLNEPDQPMESLRALPSAVILKLLYGYTLDPKGTDPLVALADETIGAAFSESFAYGTCIVDLIPPLRYLPEWLPGMGFKRRARIWSKAVSAFCEKPFAFVKHQMETGTARSSFTSEALEKSRPEDADLVKCAASTMHAGGSDTTASGLTTVFLALALNPNVLKNAQEEIDRVVGNDRLPTFSDRLDLPYIEAILKEALRWENVVEINQPHLALEEDFYMGYRIPKGSVVLANIWKMVHDPDIYPDPFNFKPERFVGQNSEPTEQDPRSIVFGFGRRICPGKEFADSTIWIAIAMIVAVFDINKAKNVGGHDIEPLNDYVPGATRHPKAFRCSVAPRSEKATNLIRSVCDEFPLEKGDGELLNSLSDGRF